MPLGARDLSRRNAMKPEALSSLRGALYAAVVGNSIRPNRSLASEVWVPFSRGFIEESFADVDLTPIIRTEWCSQNLHSYSQSCISAWLRILYDTLGHI